ncbi:flagellar hook-basal body protein [Peribacillus sp. FSL H8-0477]|uniref:flagellar hook-basal body protein n=1 Tax=Peribacillus sp. FSL H8-0477 TaxID=2921388 RepID=UPI0030FAB2CC
MLRGFYTAASGMLAQQRQTEMLTNNLANANTTGFKADQSSIRSFPEMLLQRMESKNIPTDNSLQLPVSKNVGSISTGVYVQDVTPLFSQGDVQETELKTDIALINGTMPADANGKMGTVMFVVENSNGEMRYTRNGNFTLDGTGYLTTSEGNYVLNQNNERIQLNSDDFTINQDGTISENNQAVARLGVAFAENPDSLVKEGGGLFRAADAELTDAYNEAEVSFTLNQGVLEGSNVDESQTMTELMAAYRSFEANQKMLQAYDRSMDKAVNEVGKLG